MNPENATEHMMRKLLDYDKLCFDVCIKMPEKKFTMKEENCLSNLLYLI